MGCVCASYWYCIRRSFSYIKRYSTSSSHTLKGIVRHHLPQQYKFSRKEIDIDESYDASKLFTTIPGACMVILGSKDTDQHGVIDFLVERHNYLQDQAWKHKKQGMRHLKIVYPRLKFIENTSILCLN